MDGYQKSEDQWPTMASMEGSHVEVDKTTRQDCEAGANVFAALDAAFSQ